MEAAVSSVPPSELTSLKESLPTPEDGEGSMEQVLSKPPRPAFLPEKFWDGEKGSVRLEALLKSYLSLEKKLSEMIPLPTPDGDPENWATLRRALGVPETPDGYDVTLAAPELDRDTEMEKKLHEAGFTQEQVQLLYDLAAEKMLPLLEDMSLDFEAAQTVKRLEEYFGGESRFQEVARQIMAWGERHLPEDVLENLGSTFEGVTTLYRMMLGGEPAFERGGTSAVENEGDLRELMNDPKYWRDHDPATIAKVTDGFKRLYPDQ